MFFKLLLVIFLFGAANLAGATEPQITVTLLANDKIAEVNVESEPLVQKISAALELFKGPILNLAPEQKAALLIVCHPVGAVSLELFSQPKVKPKVEEALLTAVRALALPNTRFVDFPILLTANTSLPQFKDDFKKAVLPPERGRLEYAKADLATKLALNQAWAAQVVPVLSAYQTIATDSFAGVRNFGTLLAKTNLATSQNEFNLTSRNYDYWRAVLEMNPSNQLIPTTKILILVSQGRLDYAKRLLEIVRLFSNDSTLAKGYLDELQWRLDGFYEQLHAAINAGIAEHDKGNYAAAIRAYQAILTQYPQSAWAQYERYFSQNALATKGDPKLDDRARWDSAKTQIYTSDPLYHLDVRASNAKEGYLLFRRHELSELFRGPKDPKGEVKKYAEISLDLGVLDFAAQLFWYTYTSDPADTTAIAKFLYSLDKLGVHGLTGAFRGDFETQFKAIDADRDRAMKANPAYKAFAK